VAPLTAEAWNHMRETSVQGRTDVGPADHSDSRRSDEPAMPVHIIFYVQDQARSRAFYAAVLGREPRLDVAGMTEFELGTTCVLGLMPVSGIRRLLGDALPDPAAAAGIPRAELYIHATDPETAHQRALAAGARELSGIAHRDRGDRVAYSLDPDGHVLAFAGPGIDP